MPDFLTSAEVDSRSRRGLTRDITERQRRAAADDGLLGDVAQIATLGATAYLIGRRVFRRDQVLRAMDLLGRKAHRVTAPVREVTRGLMDELAGATIASPNVRRIERFEAMESISESLAAVQQARAAGKNSSQIQSLIDASRQGFRDRGFEQHSRAGLERLRPATVADVMDTGRVGRALRGEISDTAFQVIKEGRKQGVIGGSTTLTRGYGGIFVDDAAEAGRAIVDTRFIKPSNILGAVGNLARQVQVPFIGFRPADLLIGLAKPFGEGHFAGQVGRNIELAKGVQSGSGLNFVIGGRLLREVADGGFEVAASNLRLGKMGAVGELGHLTRYGAGRGFYGRGLKNKLDKGEGNFFDHIQNVTGVGPAYRTRDPVVKSALWDPVIRREHGKYHFNENVAARDQLGFWQRLRVYREAVAKGQDPEGALSAAMPGPTSFDDMGRVEGFFEKVKAHFGLSKRVSIVRPGAGVGSDVRPEDLMQSGPEYVGMLGGKRAAVPGEAVPPGFMGKMSNPATVPNEFYAYQGTGKGVGQWLQGQAEAALDIGHYMTNRLNDLLSITAGVGFRPSEGRGVIGGLFGLGKNVAKIKGLFTGLQMGAEALSYADYLFESTVGMVLPKEWDSPRDWAIQTYRGARILQTGVREATGIRAAAAYSEDLMPGSMSSGLSFTARTLTPIIHGVSRRGMGGLKPGLALAGLIGGTDPDKPIGDVMAEFAGEKDVAVRKSRWWMLGRQPFEGGQIDYYKPHWTVEELSDYKYTDVLYGSKAEYWGNVSRLPNLHNFLGLKMLTQEGGVLGGGDLHLAKKHRITRPYPNSPGVDQAKAEEMANYMAARGPYDAPFGAGQRLGYGTAGTSAAPLEKYGGLLGSIKKQSEDLTELTGIYKFLLWDLPGFGDDDPPRLATYETIGSEARSFYDRSLGGMLGMTEMYRRFVRPEDAKQGINPIPNIAPDWLPGVRSQFEGDRTYHIDFTLGDPYAKIAKGEARLPGSGYEEMHRLHSGSAGIYDPMDRFLILADVAPHSESYKHYRAVVEGWRKAGVLDTYWSSKFETTKEQVKSKMERYKFHDRRFSGVITDPNPELTDEKYNVVEKAIGGVYETFAHDVVPKIGDVVPILGPVVSDKLFPIRSPIEHYERFQVLGEEFADWRSPYKAFVRPKANWLAAQDPLTATAGGAALGLFGANPVAAVALAAVGAGGFGATSGMRALSTGSLTGGHIPDFRNRERELGEYFNAIQYTKGRMLESRSLAMGDTKMAYHFNQQSQRTSFGVDWATNDKNTFMSQAMRSMPRGDRSYMPAFTRMPHAAQDHVMDYMTPTHAAMVAKASGRWNEPAFSSYRSMMKGDADSRVASYFQSIGGMPGPSWGGWHPDVPMDAVKIKLADTGWNSTSSDIHRFDLFSEHRFRANRFAGMSSPVQTNLQEARVDMGGVNLIGSLQDAGFDNVQFRYGIGGQEDNIHWDVQNSNWEQIRGIINGILR